jgi:hypothetical protein
MNHADHTVAADPQDTDGHQGHMGHSWMMIACCIPMLLIAGALVVTGVVSGVYLLWAVACTGMMVLMMKAMGHGGSSVGK